MIDVTNKDLKKSYKQVRNELKNYSNKLSKKKEVVVLNKIDLIDNKTLYKQKFLRYLSSNHNYYSSLNIYFISALKSSKSKILQIINNQLKNKFFFKTSYLNKIIKSINGE